MAKPVNKTQTTDADPMAFIAMVENENRRADAYRLVEIMRDETDEEPYMYGSSIIGFGSYHYVYDSGREGDAPLAGFSPRKAQMVVYLIGGYEERYSEELAQLGPYKPGKSCLYFRKLEDLDEDVLRFLIRDSYQTIKADHPTS